MCTNDFTTVAYRNRMGLLQQGIALNGHWKLRSLMAWIAHREGDQLNFSFTRHHASGRKQSFTVTEGELKEVKPEHFLSSNSICK